LKNKKILLAILLPIAIFAIILTADLLSKFFMFKLLPSAGDSREFIPGFINFIHVENKGAAWGIFAGRSVFLIILAIAIISLYVAFYVLKVKKMKEKTSIILNISVGLIAGGCIGNLIDRIFLGYVRDFINFQFFSFPVFNIADIAVCVSVVLMFLYFIIIYPKEGNEIEELQKTNDVKIENFEEKIKKNEEKNEKTIEKPQTNVKKDKINKEKDEDENER